MAVARAFILPLALVCATDASAHHPGSHAARQPDGRVRLEVAVTAADACTGIADIAGGPPPGIAAVPGTAPVTVRLQRPGGPCKAEPNVVRAERMLDLGRQEGQLLVYVMGADGTLASTERVPLR
jgi:hypothetical protein